MENLLEIDDYELTEEEKQRLLQRDESFSSEEENVKGPSERKEDPGFDDSSFEEEEPSFMKKIKENHEIYNGITKGYQTNNSVLKKINQWSQVKNEGTKRENEAQKEEDELNRSRTSFCSNLSGFLDLDENFREELLDMRKNKAKDIFPKGFEGIKTTPKQDQPKIEEKADKGDIESLEAQPNVLEPLENEKKHAQEERSRKKAMEKLKEVEKKEERMREEMERLKMLKEDARSMLVEEETRREMSKSELKKKQKVISDTYLEQKIQVFQEIERQAQDREAKERQLMAKEDAISREYEANRREIEGRQAKTIGKLRGRQTTRPIGVLLDKKGQELQRRLNSREGLSRGLSKENNGGLRQGQNNKSQAKSRAELDQKEKKIEKMNEGSSNQSLVKEKKRLTGATAISLGQEVKEADLKSKSNVQDVICEKITWIMDTEVDKVGKVLAKLNTDFPSGSGVLEENLGKKKVFSKSPKKTSEPSFSMVDALLWGFHNTEGLIKRISVLSSKAQEINEFNDEDELFGSKDLADMTGLCETNETTVPLSHLLKDRPKSLKDAEKSQIQLLFQVDLKMKGIDRIDESLALLEGASIVNLAMNKIATIQVLKNSKAGSLNPPQSCSTSIISLNLSNNKITDYSGLGCLPNLRSLNLQLNQITALCPLPSRALLTLNLSNNQITSLESLPSMPEYHSLVRLNLYRNRISNLGDALHFMQSLEDLDLGRNELANLKGIGHCVSLERLIVYYNRIEHLGEENAPLTLLFLKELVADSNCLKRLPSLFMPCLRELDLSENQISLDSSFSSIYYWPSLRVLKISNNRLTASALAEILKYSISLKEVYCFPNDRDWDQSLVSLTISKTCPNIEKSDITIIKQSNEKPEKGSKKDDWAPKNFGFLGERGSKLLEKVQSYNELDDFWDEIRRKSNGVIGKMPPVVWREISKDQNLLIKHWKKRKLYFCQEWASGKPPAENWSNQIAVIEKKLRDKRWQRAFKKVKEFLKGILIKKRLRNAHFESKITEIVRIQKIWKGHRIRKAIDAREIVKNKRREELLKKQQKASLKIQKVWRGVLIREKIRKIKESAKGTEGLFGDDEDLDFFDQEIQIKNPKLTIPDEYADLMSTFINGGSSKPSKGQKIHHGSINVNNFMGNEPINEAEEDNEEEKDSEEPKGKQISSHQKGMTSLQSIKKHPNQSTNIKGLGTLTNKEDSEMETHSVVSSEQRAHSFTGDASNSDTQTRLQDSRYTERNKGKNFNIRTTKTPTTGLLKQTKDIVETWGFKDDAVKQALQSKLMKDARRKKKKEVLNADQRFAKFVRISSKPQRQETKSMQSSVSSGKESRVGKIEEEF